MGRMKKCSDCGGERRTIYIRRYEAGTWISKGWKSMGSVCMSCSKVEFKEIKH